MDDVLDLDLHVSDSEDEETGAASFARKFNMELEGSPAVARSEYVHLLHLLIFKGARSEKGRGQIGV